MALTAVRVGLGIALVAHGLGNTVTFTASELPRFVRQRRMLLDIKELAEQG